MALIVLSLSGSHTSALALSKDRVRGFFASVKEPRENRALMATGPKDRTYANIIRQKSSKEKAGEKASVSIECTSGRSDSKGVVSKGKTRNGRSSAGNDSATRRHRGLKGGRSKAKSTAGVEGVACTESGTKNVKGVSSAKANKKGASSGEVPDREYPPVSTFKESTKSPTSAALKSGIKCTTTATKTSGKRRSTEGGRGAKASMSVDKAEDKSPADDCVEEANAESNAELEGTNENELSGNGVLSTNVEDNDGGDGDSEISSFEGSRATVGGSGGSSNNAGEKVGITVGMLGLVLVSMVALIVGKRRLRKREALEKGFHDDDDDDDETNDETKVSDNDFVFPPEEELVGPEYDARFDDPAFLQSQTDHDYPRDADTDAILRDLHSMPSYSSRHATRSSRSISTTK